MKYKAKRHNNMLTASLVILALLVLGLVGLYFYSNAHPGVEFDVAVDSSQPDAVLQDVYVSISTGADSCTSCPIFSLRVIREMISSILNSKLFCMLLHLYTVYFTFVL